MKYIYFLFLLVITSSLHSQIPDFSNLHLEMSIRGDYHKFSDRSIEHIIISETTDHLLKSKTYGYSVRGKLLLPVNPILELFVGARMVYLKNRVNHGYLVLIDYLLYEESTRHHSFLIGHRWNFLDQGNKSLFFENGGQINRRKIEHSQNPYWKNSISVDFAIGYKYEIGKNNYFVASFSFEQELGEDQFYYIVGKRRSIGLNFGFNSRLANN